MERASRRRRQHAVSFCTGVHHPSTSTGWHVCAETSLDVFRTKCHIKPGINILHFKVRVNRLIGSIIWLLHSKHMLFNDSIQGSIRATWRYRVCLEHRYQLYKDIKISLYTLAGIIALRALQTDEKSAYPHAKTAERSLEERGRALSVCPPLSSFPRSARPAVKTKLGVQQRRQ